MRLVKYEKTRARVGVNLSASQGIWMVKEVNGLKMLKLYLKSIERSALRGC